MTNQPPQRVSGIKGPEAWTPPSKPPESAGEQVLDAYRQTRFVLGADLDLLHDLMDLQLKLVKDAYQTRTHAAAAILQDHVAGCVTPLEDADDIVPIFL